MEKELGSNNYRIKYWKSGKGPGAIFTFHGYGLNHNSWSVFRNQLEENHTVYHINLPYHQGSEITLNTDLKFYRIIEDLIKAENINVEIDLLGFSLGANYILHLLQNRPKYFSKVLLMAPDGLKSFDHKKFLNSNVLGQKLKQGFIKNPKFIQKILEWTADLGFTEKKTKEYYLKSIETEDQRQSLMNRWGAVAQLDVDLKLVLFEIQKQGLDLWIYGGKSDTIIKASELKRFAGENIHLEMFDIGHNMMSVRMKEPMNSWIKSIPLPRNSE